MNGLAFVTAAAIIFFPAFLTLYKKQVTMFVETWPNGERNIQTLNKFCKVYINGFDGAKELREQLMKAGSAEALLEILNNA